MKTFFAVLVMGFGVISAQGAELRKSSAPHGMNDIAAKHSATEAAMYPLKLIDLAKGTSSKVQKDKDGNWILLPNRLYARLMPNGKGYYFDVTTKNAKFRPNRHLLKGSDLPGEWVGSVKGVHFTYAGQKGTKEYAGWARIADGDYISSYEVLHEAVEPGDVEHTETIPYYQE